MLVKHNTKAAKNIVNLKLTKHGSFQTDHLKVQHNSRSEPGTNACGMNDVKPKPLSNPGCIRQLTHTLGQGRGSMWELGGAGSRRKAQGRWPCRGPPAPNDIMASSRQLRSAVGRGFRTESKPMPPHGSPSHEELSLSSAQQSSGLHAGHVTSFAQTQRTRHFISGVTTS